MAALVGVTSDLRPTAALKHSPDCIKTHVSRWHAQHAIAIEHDASARIPAIIIRDKQDVVVLDLSDVFHRTRVVRLVAVQPHGRAVHGRDLECVCAGNSDD